MSQQAPAEQEVAPRGGVRTALAALGLAVALLAAGAAGFAWWQSAERFALLESSERRALDSLEQRVQALQAGERTDAQRLAGLEKGLESEHGRVSDVTARIDGLPGRVGALEQRVEAGSGSSDARSAWLRSEAEYYLTTANTELALRGRWETAIAALELADDRLRKLSDPSFAPVRETVADELLELRAVKLPDLEGLAFSLGRLAARVDELPLRVAGAGAGAGKARPLEAAKPGLGRLWLAVKSALAGIVSVRRSDEAEAEALSAGERSLARRQLRLELELARAAALGSEPGAFKASLENAGTLLERDFDSESTAVTGAEALLAQIAEVDVAPKRPDISRSLEQFRHVGGKN